MQTTTDRNAAAACPAARGAPPAREDGTPTRHPLRWKAPGPPPPGGRGLPGMPPPRLSSLRWKAPPPNARNKAKPYSSHGRHSWKAPGPGEVRGRAETAEEKRARGVPVHVIKRNQSLCSLPRNCLALAQARETPSAFLHLHFYLLRFSPQL